MQLGVQIGVRNTADVFDIGNQKVVKLFHLGYPERVMRVEFRNSQLLSALDIPIVKSYEIITFEGRHGIVYDIFECGSTTIMNKHIDIEFTFGEYYEVCEGSFLFQYICTLRDLPLLQREQKKIVIYQK